MNEIRKKKIIICVVFFCILLLGFYVRSAGLFRGLDNNRYIFHPDTPKQIVAISSYLNNRYLWYHDHFHYDGYPFALNHVDEMIIRGVYAVVRPLYAHMSPEMPTLQYPGRFTLFYYARMLRVLYGMVALVLIIITAKMLLNSWAYAFITGFFLALAPLSYTVSHIASGDIGINLFFSIMLFLLCLYYRHDRVLFLLLAGIASGFAFAAKYQGALIFGSIFCYAFLRNRYIPKKIAGFFTQVAVSLSCFFIGALIATPAVFINAKQTVRDIVNNFVKLKDSGVDQVFASKPLIERMWLGLCKNVPSVITGFGIVFFLIACIGFVLLSVELIRAFRKKDTDKTATPVLLLWPIAVVPFFVLFLATSLKPNLQVVHFAFLELPLCLVGAYTILYLSGKGKKWGKYCAAGLFLIAGFELSAIAQHELFFWSREDADFTAKIFKKNAWPGELYTSRTMGSENVIKDYFLEKGELSLFRNSPEFIVHKDADFWKKIHILPVPSIPFPVSLHWIFMNGPVFPRNDRMFVVTPENQIQKELVFYEPVPSVSVGLRTSDLPTEVHIRLGGVSQKVTLDANSQKVIELSPKKWKTFSDKSFDSDVRIVPLSVFSALDTVWVTVLSNEKERAWFDAFGASSLKGLDPFLTEYTDSKVTAALKDIAYYDRDVDGFEPISGEGTRIQKDPFPLGAGVYTLECEVIGLDEENIVSIDVKDPAFLFAPSGANKQTFRIEKGKQRIVFKFTKEFAPYVITIMLQSVKGNCALSSWRLYPDSEKILGDLITWDKTGEEPQWFAQYPPIPEYVEKTVPEIVFNTLFELKSYVFPEKMVVGESFAYGFRFDILDYDIKDILEIGVFVHLKDSSGSIVNGYDFPLSLACFGKAPMLYPLSGVVPDTLVPGEYDLVIGLYNTRLRKQFPVSAKKDPRFEIGKKSVLLQKIKITKE